VPAAQPAHACHSGSYEAVEARLDPGDLLVRASLRRRTLPAGAFTDGVPQADDMTCVVLNMESCPMQATAGYPGGQM